MMQENTLTHESTNWLTIYPAKTERQHQQLSHFAESLGNFPDTQQIVLALDEALQSGEWKGKKLNQNNLALLKDVYDYISKGIELGVDEAVSLKLRQITDSEVKKEAREKAETEQTVEVWSYFSGDYRGLVVGDSLQEKKKYPLKAPETGDSKKMWDASYVPHEHAGDTVHFLSRRIEQLLDTQESKPVVVVDIGAMYGTTLLELALQYKKEVEAGRLVFIATNIGLNSEVIQNTPKPRNGLGLYGNYEQLFQEAGSLVHFLVTDTEGLLNKTILLPNGKQLTLEKDSVDIVHENWSISKHSKSLEVDVAALAELVGKKGMIMSHRNDPWRGGGGLSTTGINTSYTQPATLLLQNYSKAKVDYGNHELDEFEMRNIGGDMLTRANDTLSKHAFTLVEQVTDSKTRKAHELNYSFWLGKNAEPVSVYGEDGSRINLLATAKEKSRRGNLGFISVLKSFLGNRGVGY